MGFKVFRSSALFTSNMLRGVPQSLLFKAPVVAVPLLPWENSLPRRGGDHHKAASDDIYLHMFVNSYMDSSSSQMVNLWYFVGKICLCIYI